MELNSYRCAASERSSSCIYVPFEVSNTRKSLRSSAFRKRTFVKSFIGLRKDCSESKMAEQRRMPMTTRTGDTMRDDEFEAVIQQAFLAAFPNPDRMGCPGDEVLRSLAAKMPLGNNQVESHVAQCSPCAREILAFRAQTRKRRETRWLLAAAAACLAAGVSLAAYRELSSHRNVGPDQSKSASLIVAKLDFSKELPATRRASRKRWRFKRFQRMRKNFGSLCRETVPLAI